MVVYLIWEYEPHSGFEKVIKVLDNAKKASKFIEFRDKMTGCDYRVEAFPVE